MSQRPAPENWIDNPATPGDWNYVPSASGSLAFYGTPGGEPRFTVTCDRSAGRIALARAGSAGQTVPMRVLTETRASVLDAVPVSAPNQLLEAQLAPRDALLDAMAYSRGRFAVEVPGLPTLYIPVWAEFSKVVEDCR